MILSSTIFRMADHSKNEMKTTCLSHWNEANTFKSLIHLGVCLALSPAGALAAAPEATTIWALGTADGAAMEFAPGARAGLTFTVGQSVLSKDFAGYQDGSVGYDGKVAEKPYRIRFDLPGPPEGNYELTLDLIYSSGAPTHLKVMINDRAGIFPVRPAPKHSASGEEGNAMLMAGQHLVVRIPGPWLKQKGNEIGLVPVGIGGMSYDALKLQQARDKGFEQPVQLEPSIFYRKHDGKLFEVCQIIAPFEKRFAKGMATVHFGNQTFNKTFTTEYDFGVLSQEIEIPSGCLGESVLELDLDGTKQQARGSFKPARQWRVFICPKVHNDVGYTDLQPHVNELDNRNTDTVLDVLA